MPAFLTHRAAGERVLCAPGEITVPHQMAFYLGCQGPDILFFRNFQLWKSSKDSLALGIVMHKRKTRDLFIHMLNWIKQYDGRDRDECLSYFAGFVTHYAIDKTAHPFVNDKAQGNMAIHHAIESMWDMYSAAEQWDITPRQFDFYSEIMYGEIAPGIDTWYRAAAQDVYGHALDNNAICQAQRDFAKAKKALARLRWPGKAFLCVIGALNSYNVLTLLYPKEKDASLFSAEEYEKMRCLISKGVVEAAEMVGFLMAFAGARDEMVVPEWFGDRNFAGVPENNAVR